MQCSLERFGPLGGSTGPGRAESRLERHTGPPRACWGALPYVQGRKGSGETQRASQIPDLHTAEGPRPAHARRMTGPRGLMPVCTECYEFRTNNPSGVCAICRRRTAKAPSLIAQFAADIYIDKPFPADLELPCMRRRDDYMKPKASQTVRDLCDSCPRVAYDWCLSWGIANDEQGIWGGLSRDERKLVREGLPDLTQAHYTLVA